MSKPDRAITIGFFDGVHLGHQALICALNAYSSNTMVVTFSNHPSLAFGYQSPLLLTTHEQKKELLENLGVNKVHSIAFTPEFSRLSAKQFLCNLYRQFPFSHLILGHDAAIGYHRQGTPEVLKEIAKELQFELHYITPEKKEEVIVSSSIIRTLINEGKIDKVPLYLGRAYCLRLERIIDCKIHEMCIPPEGNYVGFLKNNSQKVPCTLSIQSDKKASLLFSTPLQQDQKNFEFFFSHSI